MQAVRPTPFQLSMRPYADFASRPSPFPLTRPAAPTAHPAPRPAPAPRAPASAPAASKRQALLKAVVDADY
ncbi:hypothetical protein CVT26_001148 [Gymnopilus dilepis]|uniref:Uncharacterized protein n=1 Tax=Gymnopilus dilepis TaxID=231916 RepID=A0A409YMY1_9AGAR|nr:hypothetical protein CVT26_001148 [Gymnopilus dilepis]